MGFTKFGPGTVTYTIAQGTPVDFAAEVKSGGVQHSYEDVGDATTYLDGHGDTPYQVRADSITFECDLDLTSAGYYNFLYTNDGEIATVVYTPNTVDGAKWEGEVRCSLPESATAEGFGGKISGAVTHSFVSPATFTPATAAP